MRAVGYRKSLPVDDPEALFDFETAKPAPRGRDIHVAVKAISANPVDYKVRKRAAPPAGETKILGDHAAGIVDAVGPEVTLFKAGDEGLLCRLDPAPGHQFGISSGRRTHRPGRKPASLSFAQAAALPLTATTVWELLFDRLGSVPGKSVDPRHPADHGRRRRRRLHPDPARAPAHRTDRRRDREPAGIAAMVPRSRRPRGHRSRQADARSRSKN